MAEGLANRMRSGSAGGGLREVGTFTADPHGNLTRRHVGYDPGNEKRRNFTRPSLDQNGVVFLNGGQSTHAAPGNHANAMRICFCYRQAAVLPG